jgi:sirohydrochlorin ferrochelatase
VAVLSGQLKRFDQEEYAHVLEEHGGHDLAYTQAIGVLMEHGASFGQAKNAAYIYLHHGEHTAIRRKGSQNLYDEILDEFHGRTRGNMDCIRHLESLGFSQGQAKNAVYKYRRSRGLIR